MAPPTAKVPTTGAAPIDVDAAPSNDTTSAPMSPGESRSDALEPNPPAQPESLNESFPTTPSAAADPIDAPPAPPASAAATPASASAPTATTTPTDPVIRDRSMMAGVEFGFGIPSGGTSAFSNGFGRAFYLGFQNGAWGIGIRFSERYDVGLSLDTGAEVDGSVRASSMLVHRFLHLPGQAFLGELVFGVASASTPILVYGPNGNLIADDRRGVGGVGGIGLAVPVAGGVFIGVQARLYYLRWENVGEMILLDVDETGAAMFGVSPDSGIPTTVTAGLRFVL